MTISLFFSAMAKQHHRLRTGEVLEQTKSKLLSVVFDRSVASIDRSSFKQLAAIAPANSAQFIFRA
jgi:hypothetical protein